MILCGLIGAGIQGSRSPALHEAEARAQGLQLRYELIDLDVLGAGPEARAIGAVNTVVISDGKLTGHNTDGPGWGWGFRRAYSGFSPICLTSPE